MLPLLFNLKVVLITLFILNLLAIFLFKKEYRFVKGQVILFAVLFIVFLGYRFLAYPTINANIQDNKNLEIKKRGWDYINHPDVDQEFTKKEVKNRTTNLALFRIAGIQAAFAFIFSFIGIFITSEKKIYAAFALGFLVIAFLFFK